MFTFFISFAPVGFSKTFTVSPLLDQFAHFCSAGSSWALARQTLNFFSLVCKRMPLHSGLGAVWARLCVWIISQSCVILRDGTGFFFKLGQLNYNMWFTLRFYIYGEKQTYLEAVLSATPGGIVVQAIISDFRGVWGKHTSIKTFCLQVWDAPNRRSRVWTMGNVKQL